MRTLRLTLLLLALTGALSGPAWAYSVALRTEPYTDVLSFDFGDAPLPPHSVRRTGPQQLTVTFHQPPGSPLVAAPALAGSSLVAAVQPTAKGFNIQLKTRAFGYVSAPLPGKAEFEIHVFSDVVGGRWVDLSPKALTLAPAKKDAPAAIPASRPSPLPLPLPATGPEQNAAPEPEPKARETGPERTETVPQAPEPARAPEPPAPPQGPEPVQSAPEPRAPALLSDIRAGVRAGIRSEAQADHTPEPAPSEPDIPPGLPRMELREAMDIALKNNPRISSYENRTAGAELNIKSARGALLPRAMITAGLTKVKNPENKSETNSDYINQLTKSYSLQVSQNVFDGLMRLSNLARVKLLSVRTEQERRRVELDTAESVQREYFKLIRTRSDIRTFSASVERLNTQKEAAHAFYRLEMAPRLTVLQVETALAQAEQRLSRARSDEKVQLTKLNALLGHSGTPRYDFAGELGHYTYLWQLNFDECVRQAQNKLPEVIIAKTDVEIAQEELNIVEGKAYPKVDATATYNKQNTTYSNGTPSADRQYYTMGLNMAWEVFSSGEQYYEAQARKKLLKAAQDDLSGIMLSVYSVVRESYLNVSEAKTQIRIAHLRAKEAGEAYEQASTRFRSGIGTSLDVLDAQEKVVTAEAALNQAQAEFFISLANLYRTMGQHGMPLSGALSSGLPGGAATADGDIK